MAERRRGPKPGLGKYEQVFPQVIQTLESATTYEKAYLLAMDAGLTKRQWESVCSYMDNGNVGLVAKEMKSPRSNVYYFLNAAFAKLQGKIGY